MSDATDGMTVDEVARAAGTTTRNVRSYQTRGLLPPPHMNGRVGLYGREHLARLRLIAKLQERGYSLAAIGDLLRAWEERVSLGELLGLREELRSGIPDEPEQIMTRSELVQHFPLIEHDLEFFSRVVDLELVVPLPRDRSIRQERYRIPSPRLLEVGRQLLEADIPLDVALDELARLRQDAAQIAERLVEIVTRHLWDPWVAAGRPTDEVPAMVEHIRRLKPLPGLAMQSVLAQALDEEIGRVVARKMSDLEPEPDGD